MSSTNPAATSAHVPSPRHSTPPISAAPEASFPRPTLARPSTPTAAEASVVEATRSKPRAPDHWAELQSNWRRKSVLSKVSELFEEAGADETYEDFVDRSYVLINEASPSEKDFVDTFKVGSDQYPTRSALERICLFGCGDCGKPFTRMANLVRHWSLHRRPSILDISARSEETIDLSRSAELRGLAVAPAEPPQVPSLRKSRAVTTRVTQALGQIAGPLPVQELLPARTRHIRYTTTALMRLFAVTLLLTTIQLNIESYHEHKQKLAHAVKALAACQDGSHILPKVCNEVKLRATAPTIVARFWA